MAIMTVQPTAGCPVMSAIRGREASLNWLALGLLLAAWNASDNDAHGRALRTAGGRCAAIPMFRCARGASCRRMAMKNAIHKTVNVL